MKPKAHIIPPKETQSQKKDKQINKEEEERKKTMKSKLIYFSYNIHAHSNKLRQPSGILSQH